LEEKINSQKKKFDEKMNLTVNEYEEKLKEQEQQSKNELDNLQFAYEDLEAKYNALSVDAQHQILLLTEKLLTADNILNEDKENLLKLTNAHNKDLERKILEFNKERKELGEKIDALNAEKVKLSQELNKKNEIIMKLKNTIQEKENEIEDSKKEYDTAIDRIINKFEQYKQKQQDLINEFNIKKLEYQRENNLLKQQIDYLNRKIQEQILFYEESDKSHEDNINELRMELEETFTNKLNEIMNDKKDLYEKLRLAENQIRELNNKNSALCKIYDERINDEKINHQNACDEYEVEIKKLKQEKSQLQKKSSEPILKINKLLEDKTSLQSEIYKYKDIIQKCLKEKEELENIIQNLENEKNNLIIEKENLISNMNHIDSRIKSKGPKSTDMSKRLQNIGQSSLNMIRTDIAFEKSAKKKSQSNVSIDSGIFEDKNNMSLSGIKNLNNTISATNSSGHKIKINNSFSGSGSASASGSKQKKNDSNRKSLVKEKGEEMKKNNELNDEEKNTDTPQNNK
jgi:chromosome segregation ATPase